MNKHVKLFYKQYVRKMESPSEYNNRMFAKALLRVLTEFRYKHQIVNTEVDVVLDDDNEHLLQMGGKYGITFKITDLVKDLEYAVPKGIFYDYMDHLLSAKDNKLQALSYEEFLNIQGIKINDRS